MITPASLAHYLAACAVAKLDPRVHSSRWMIEELATLAIPAAAARLRTLAMSAQRVALALQTAARRGGRDFCTAKVGLATNGISSRFGVHITSSLTASLGEAR